MRARGIRVDAAPGRVLSPRGSAPCRRTAQTLAWVVHA